jgi:translation initiation factor 2-alpha kinase 4
VNSVTNLISIPLSLFFSAAAPDSTHYQTLLSVLFKRPASQASQTRNLLYDLAADIPEHANLNTIVEDRIKAIFRLHGAVDMEPPLLAPSTNPEENEPRPTFIDSHGDVVFLPNQALIPFARLAARNGVKRIKRFHIMNTYRPK